MAVRGVEVGLDGEGADVGEVVVVDVCVDSEQATQDGLDC